MFSGWPSTWAMPVAATLVGYCAEQEVHDRQVVHGEVPDHADVVLEQAEVHAHRVVVVELAELPVADELVDLAHGARVDEGVVDHQRQPALVGLGDELLALGRRSTSSASRPRRACRPGGPASRAGSAMTPAWRSRPRRRRGRRACRRRRRRCCIVGYSLLDRGRSRSSLWSHDRDDTRAVDEREVPDEVRSPVPVADDGDSDHVRLLSCCVVRVMCVDVADSSFIVTRRISNSVCGRRRLDRRTVPRGTHPSDDPAGLPSTSA